ncbi:Nucleoside-diphosphate-sugar epimerase [Sediminibacillus albus]|uniref:Nucleoside-diphosphate-sugar epimerase n=2 Tax=Sediminibacillus albus TaxID=407036 RepID=A0A1G8WZZ5_9BACI|nr:Nucleoside-diphosphate-sugar epimerase [Sediminibacillus albus]
MKKALVLGASGAIGRAITFELANRGVAVTAFARHRDKLERLFKDHPQIAVHSGDVFSKDELVLAASGNDVIFHAINLPYPEWGEKQPILLANILEAARIQQAKLAMVDNIYAYAKSERVPVPETYAKQPPTKKGTIRLELENMAKQSEVPVLIAHFPDFYGPGVESSVLNYTFQSIVRNKGAMFVGNQKIHREFIYTPDGAKAIVNLAMQEAAYGQNWNIPGAGTITGREIIQIAKAYTGYSKKVRTVTKPMIRMLGLFDSMMREYVEMFYLNEIPLILSGDKYEKHIGPVPRTSYREGVEQTLSFMQRAQ